MKPPKALLSATVFVLLSFGSLAARAQETTAESPPQDDASIELTVGMLVIAVVVGLCLGTLAYWVLRRSARQQHEKEREAARAFEHEMMKTFRAQPQGHAATSSAQAPERTPNAAPPSEPVGESPPTPAAPAMGDVEKVLETLREGGILQSDEGPFHMPHDGSVGRLVTLRGDKRALIVTPSTPPEVVEAQSGAYDYVVWPRPGTAPLLCRRLGDYIAERIFDSTV